MSDLKVEASSITNEQFEEIKELFSETDKLGYDESETMDWVDEAVDKLEGQGFDTLEDLRCLSEAQAHAVIEHLKSHVDDSEEEDDIVDEDSEYDEDEDTDEDPEDEDE